MHEHEQITDEELETWKAVCIMDNSSRSDYPLRLMARLDAAERGRDVLQNALHKIVDWAGAYPLRVFPEPNLKRAHKVLEAAGMTLDSISASAMRHVVTGVGKIASDALNSSDTKGNDMHEQMMLQEQDDRAQTELDQERRETTMDAIYECAMYGASEAALKVICRETGIAWLDMQMYRPRQ